MVDIDAHAETPESKLLIYDSNYLLQDVDQLLNKTNLFTRSLVVKSTTLTLNFFLGGGGRGGQDRHDDSSS